MKVNILEAHDRYNHLIEDQSDNVYKGAEDCMKLNPLSLAIQARSPYVYIFAHARTLGLDERIAEFNEDIHISLKYNCARIYETLDQVPSKSIFWQPRLSIPEAQTNSYLFRALSHTDLIEIYWMIPPKEMWNEYKTGNVTENDWVLWSINQFQVDKKALEKPHPDDMPEEKARMIMKNIVDEHRANLSQKKLMDRLYDERMLDEIIDIGNKINEMDKM